MKTMLFFLCLFSFSVVMAQNDKLLTKQDVIGREMFINDEWVRLREGPSLNDKIITSLGYGKAGVILEVSTESIVAGESNRWYRIQLPYGEIGWVWGKYVSLVAEVAEVEKIRRVSDTVLTQNDLDVHGLSNIQSISDIIPYLENMEKINKIIINASYLKNLDGFDSFTGLTQLFLSNVDINDCRGLINCKNLSSLRLVDSNIVSLDGIQNLKLKTLNLSGSKIKNLKDIIFPLSLESLCLENFPDYSYLIQNLPESIRSLYLGYNNITSLEQIIDLKTKTNLYELSFPGNFLNEKECRKIMEWGNIKIFYMSSD